MLNLKANIGYQNDSIGDSNNYHKQGATQDIGSQITSFNDIIVTAGGNIDGVATTIISDFGDIGMQATGGAITFTEGRATQNLSSANRHKDSDFFGSTTTQNSFDMTQNTAISNTFLGNRIEMTAKEDISLTAVDAFSDRGITLKSKTGDVQVLAAQNTYTSSRVCTKPY